MLTALLASTLVLAPRQTPPLFATDETLEVRLTLDVESLRRDRRGEPEPRAATLEVHDGGETVVIPTRVAARGHFRRENCTVPPVRLYFDPGDVESTVFEGQSALKVVVPCRPASDRYEQYVLIEYAIYRAYLVLTQQAFRVRLARIAFVDRAQPEPEFIRFAFFIENEDQLAARLGGSILDVDDGENVRARSLDPVVATRVAIFEYMIGNTDWSDVAVQNVVIVRSGTRLVVVPYDFDFSGLVDAPYAVPAERIPVRSVRERYYLGWCWPGFDTELLLRPLRAARSHVEDAVAHPGLTQETRTRVLAYLAESFREIETPDRARRFLRDCRELPR